MNTTIEKLESFAAEIRDGQHEQVRPGMPFRLNSAAREGDGVWQGDLGIEIVSSVPIGHKQIISPSEADKQLVPGDTVGSRHCLKLFAGVALYRRSDWDEESLIGPCLVCDKDTEILHPVHGTITIEAGHTVLCRYQREWDRELAKERRAAD